MNDSTLNAEMLTQAEILALVGHDTDVLFRGLGSRNLHAQFSEDGSTWTAEKDCVDAWLSDKPCEHNSVDERRRLTVEDYKGKKPISFSPIYEVTDPRWVMTMNTQREFDESTPEARAELFLDFVGFISPLRTVAQMTDCGFKDCDWATHNEGQPQSEWSHTISRFEMNYLEGSVDATGSGDKAYIYVDIKTHTFTRAEYLREFADELVELQQEILAAADAIDAVTASSRAKLSLVE